MNYHYELILSSDNIVPLGVKLLLNEYNVLHSTAVTSSNIRLIYTLLQLPSLAANKRYHWRVSGVNAHGEGSYLKTASFMAGKQITSMEKSDAVPADFKLYQNYPNPYNPLTQIACSVPQIGFISLKVYNSQGKEVAILFEGVRPAGKYVAVFDVVGLANGVY